MSEHHEDIPQESAAKGNDNSFADAAAILAMILIVWAGCIFWVASQ